VVGLASGPAVAGQESGSEPCWLSAAEIAARLRGLAQDAYRVAKDRHAAPSELVEISRRIEELRVHARVSRLFEIERWLERASEVVSQRQTA
jgi:hypothetical protein